MATTDAGDLLAMVDSLANMDIDKELVQRQRLGEAMSFSDIRDQAVELQSLSKRLLALGLDLPPHVEHPLATAVRAFKPAIDAVERFDPGSQNSGGGHATAVGNFQRLGQQLSAALLDALQARFFLSDDTAAATSAASKKTLAELQAQLTTAKEASSSITTLAAKSGVVQESTTFKNRATEFDKSAQTWLAASVATGAVAALYAFVAYILIDTPEDIAAVAARFVPLSLLLFATGYCARNYSAAMHNKIVNERKADALTVFEVFTNGAATPEAKDAVLREATSSIFSTQASGFVRNGQAESKSPSTVVEVVKRVIEPGD